MGLVAGDVMAINEVSDALGSTLDLSEALRVACPLLLRAIPASYVAVGMTTGDRPNEIDWIAPSMPSGFFEAYSDMAPHDFVFRAVLERPNRVLRDSEMIARKTLEANPMYGRARDLGMPIEHVMSTLLVGEGDGSTGVSLYRAERRPFSNRDRRLFERLIPSLKNTVRNCRLFRDGGTWEALLSQHGIAAAIISPSGAEVARSTALTSLVERWFPASERRFGKLPRALLEGFGSSSRGPREVRLTAGTRDLVARLYSLPAEGKILYGLVLEEVPNAPCAPAKWRRRLRPQEFEVAERVVRGWDNRLVADDLGCAEGTVKVHLRSIFEKLGVDTRAKLMNLAMRELLAPALPEN
jgi:DNA-binding CsgD family transcriptional regulator